MTHEHCRGQRCGLQVLAAGGLVGSPGRYVLTECQGTHDRRVDIQVAHALGLRVVAEGVESKPVASQLVSMGVDTLLGLHLACAMPAAHLAGCVARLAEASACQPWQISGVSLSPTGPSRASDARARNPLGQQRQAPRSLAQPLLGQRRPAQRNLGWVAITWTAIICFNVVLLAGCGTMVFNHQVSVLVDAQQEVSAFDLAMGDTRDWAKRTMRPASPTEPYTMQLSATSTRMVGDSGLPEDVRFGLALPGRNDAGYYVVEVRPAEGQSQQISAPFVAWDPAVPTATATTTAHSLQLQVDVAEQPGGWALEVQVAN